MKEVRSDLGPIHQAHYKTQTDDQFDQTLSAEMARRTQHLQDNTVDLAIRVKEAREFLSWSAAHMRKSWIDWMDEANKASKDITMLRMAIDRETKTTTAAAKDICALFNAPDYITAHERFRDLVGLLERFSALQQNGTMDAFADFILKVTCK